APLMLLAPASTSLGGYGRNALTRTPAGIPRQDPLARLDRAFWGSAAWSAGCNGTPQNCHDSVSTRVQLRRDPQKTGSKSRLPSALQSIIERMFAIELDELPTERLEAEITRLYSRISAEMCRWL